jgi:hypothetical protein
MRHEPAGTEPVAWWRVRMMWLVIGGPAIVVAASLVTAVIAHHSSDTVVSMPRGSGTDAQAPAMKARNHAQTPAR